MARPVSAKIWPTSINVASTDFESCLFCYSISAAAGPDEYLIY